MANHSFCLQQASCHVAYIHLRTHSIRQLPTALNPPSGSPSCHSGEGLARSHTALCPYRQLPRAAPCRESHSTLVFQAAVQVKQHCKEALSMSLPGGGAARRQDLRPYVAGQLSSALISAPLMSRRGCRLRQQLSRRNGRATSSHTGTPAPGAYLHFAGKLLIVRCSSCDL